MFLMHLDKILFLISHLAAVGLGYFLCMKAVYFTLKSSPPCPACGFPLIPTRGRLRCLRCHQDIYFGTRQTIQEEPKDENSRT